MESYDFSNLVDAELYRCRIASFQTAFHQLIIIVQKIDEPEKRYMIVFSGVEYIDSPIEWKSAAFRHGTDNELLKMRRSFNWWGASDEQLMPTDRSRPILFIVTPKTDLVEPHERRDIKILASFAVLRDVPKPEELGENDANGID